MPKYEPRYECVSNDPPMMRWVHKLNQLEAELFTLCDVLGKDFLAIIAKLEEDTKTGLPSYMVRLERKIAELRGTR